MYKTVLPLRIQLGNRNYSRYLKEKQFNVGNWPQSLEAQQGTVKQAQTGHSCKLLPPLSWRDVGAQSKLELYWAVHWKLEPRKRQSQYQREKTISTWLLPSCHPPVSDGLNAARGRKKGRKEGRKREKVGKEGRDKEGRKRNLLISSDINVIWKAERSLETSCRGHPPGI